MLCTRTKIFCGGARSLDDVDQRIFCLVLSPKIWNVGMVSVVPSSEWYLFYIPSSAVHGIWHISNHNVVPPRYVFSIWLISTHELWIIMADTIVIIYIYCIYILYILFIYYIYYNILYIYILLYWYFLSLSWRYLPYISIYKVCVRGCIPKKYFFLWYSSSILRTVPEMAIDISCN